MHKLKAAFIEAASSSVAPRVQVGVILSVASAAHSLPLARYIILYVIYNF